MTHRLPRRALLPALCLALLATGCAGPATTNRGTPGAWTDLPGAFAAGAPGTRLAPAAAPGLARPQEAPQDQADGDEGRSTAHVVLLYLPNRIFDLLDIVRARLRVGPGFGLTLRATELADLKLGAWASVYVGLHGPRGEPSIPWPVGFDMYSGAGVSVLEVEADEAHYGRGEIGVGLHFLIVGVDVGVDVLEIADFVTGLVTIDLVGDDY